MAELEEVAAALPAYRNRREIRTEARAVSLARLPNQSMELGGALYLAQGAQCFHCGGPMPIFGDWKRPHACTREHALPRGARGDLGLTDGAYVLAHRLCNSERAERRFTAIEWRRAGETWSRCVRISIGTPGIASTFFHWAELAQHMAKEST